MDIHSEHHAKLYQKVAHRIVSAIRQGIYPPGERLPPERELAEEFGVSRPTVREAMIALEIQGIVEARRGSGIYVVEASPADNEPELDIGPFEVTEARRLFEGEACALAAAIITDEELRKLEGLLETLAAHKDSAVGERADRDFHIAIAEATRNSAIAAVIEKLWDMRYNSPICMRMFDEARAAGVQPRHDDHNRILKALQARDPQAARAAMHSHLDRVINSLLAATETEALERARNEVASRREQIAKRRAI